MAKAWDDRYRCRAASGGRLAPAARLTNLGTATVANIKSQIKRNRQNEDARQRNKAVRSELKTRRKAAVSAVGSDGAASALSLAVKRIDMAAAKGVIHKNKANRDKSRLMRSVANAGS